MAIAGGFKVCPDCKGEVPLPVPEWCPHCNTNTAYRNEVRRAELSKVYAHRWKPTSVFELYSKETKELTEKPKGDEETASFIRDMEDLKKELFGLYRSLPANTKKNILLDSFHIMKKVMHSNMAPEEMKMLIEIGKKVGDVSKAAEEFIKVCGVE